MEWISKCTQLQLTCVTGAAKLPSVPLGLLSYHTRFMSKYQVLAMPHPHTKSKTLVSHDRYGIVFMHGQNVMADISAQSQSFHFGLHLYILILGHCLFSGMESLMLITLSCDPKLSPAGQ